MGEAIWHGGNNTLKKLVLILIVYILSIALVLSLTFITTSGPNINPKADISTETVDNQFNNINCNTDHFGLIKSDTNFYYNFKNSIFHYGTYEFGNGEKDRIYWEGPSLTAKTMNLSYEYNGKILFPGYKQDYYFDTEGYLYSYIENGYIYYYNIENQKYERYIKIDSPDDTNLSYFFVTDNKLYLADETKERIYLYDDGSYTLVASAELCGHGYTKPLSFYKNIMYFMDEGMDVFFKYDLASKSVLGSVNRNELKNERLYTTAISSVTSLEDDLFVTCERNSKSYIYRISFGNKSIEEVFKTNERVFLNGYGKTVVFGLNTGNDRGLFVIDSDNNIKRIYSGTVEELYIFDNKGVYFVGYNNDLYYMNYNGENLVEVFGWL